MPIRSHLTAFFVRSVRSGAMACAVIVAVAGSAPVAGQTGFPVYGTPGLPGNEVHGAPTIPALGRWRAFSRILVRFDVVESCLLRAFPEQNVSIRCSEDVPFVAVLVSDTDPTFEKTLSFSVVADEWRPTDALVPIAAQRLVVDY